MSVLGELWEGKEKAPVLLLCTQLHRNHFCMRLLFHTLASLYSMARFDSKALCPVRYGRVSEKALLFTEVGEKGTGWGLCAVNTWAFLWNDRSGATTGTR